MTLKRAAAADKKVSAARIWRYATLAGDQRRYRLRRPPGRGIRRGFVGEVYTPTGWRWVGEMKASYVKSHFTFDESLDEKAERIFVRHLVRVERAEAKRLFVVVPGMGHEVRVLLRSALPPRWRDRLLPKGTRFFAQVDTRSLAHALDLRIGPTIEAAPLPDPDDGLSGGAVVIGTKVKNPNATSMTLKRREGAKISLFAGAVSGLLDKTDFFTRFDWVRLLGVSESALSQWTKDKAVPRPEHLRVILDLLRTSAGIPQAPLEEFDRVAALPAAEVSPLSDRFGATVEQYLKPRKVVAVEDRLRAAASPAETQPFLLPEEIKQARVEIQLTVEFMEKLQWDVTGSDVVSSSSPIGAALNRLIRLQRLMLVAEARATSSPAL